MNRPLTQCRALLVLTVLVGLLTSAGAALAAEDPLEVQTSNVKGKDGSSLAWSVTNRSNREIVAYTIVADLFDSAGKRVAQLSTNAIMNLTSSKGSRGSLAPGATAGSNRPFSLPLESNGRPVDSRVFVDYVLFKDGSTWGPDVTKQSLKITGMQDGWRMSRAELKRLLAEHGIQAVAEVLAN